MRRNSTSDAVTHSEPPLSPGSITSELFKGNPSSPSSPFIALERRSWSYNRHYIYHRCCGVFLICAVGHKLNKSMFTFKCSCICLGSRKYLWQWGHLYLYFPWSINTWRRNVVDVLRSLLHTGHLQPLYFLWRKNTWNLWKKMPNISIN